MRLTLLVVARSVPALAFAQEWKVDSPDRRTVVSVQRHDDGRLTWSVQRGGADANGYVGALNGRDVAADAGVPLGFHVPGTWSASIIRDGDGDRTFASETKAVSSTDGVAISMRARGGFVLRLVPAKGDGR